MSGMLSREEINSLVVSYQKGNEEAINDLFLAINPIIEKASNELDRIVLDVTKFDCRIIMKVKRLAETFSKERHDFVAAVKAIVSNEKSDFINRRSRNLEEISYEFLAEPDGGEDSLGYQFTDLSEDVEEEVLFKEKIALLAQGDSRKETILSQWTKGATDTSISELLAKHFGGKAESHRKFISRFKSELRGKLGGDSV